MVRPRRHRDVRRGLELRLRQVGGVFLNGQGIPDPDTRGERVVDDSFLLLLNAHHEGLRFTIPARDWGERWVVVLDTDDLPLLREEVAGVPAWEPDGGDGEPLKSGDEVEVGARSLVVLRRVD